MSIIEIILFPIIWLMGIIIGTVHGLTGSYGVAIIALSVIVYVALFPLRKIASRIQQQEMELQAKMAAPIREAKSKYKGEQQFNEIERIYNEHNYHPIKSVRTALGLAIQIPFLLAALLLLIDYPGLTGQHFLFVGDLGSPDRTLLLPFFTESPLSHVNLLPLIMLAITFTESFVTSGTDMATKVRSNIVGVVIFVIIYPLPSGIVLYWTFNNLWSLGAALLRRWQERHSIHGMVE
jgi:YidC/Oxa1 family membrane protein insertase